ncbi:MAG TPA: non-homologous end-joining DNA ligase [Nitrososphaeraceae archaeon]|nr:non-homologous end-joining DNA ligase [Nitrososphaeraceae archaeon]
MSLREYNKKRDFKNTPEPSGSWSSASRETNRKVLRFVIQKHNASRLHYDFRLETPDGVLLSWAVPKGPSLSPSQKRLAVETEDHPLDYIDFEGVIPEGNYGAGTVIVWDTGTYTTEQEIRQQFSDGKISFSLSGKKIKGSFVLIRIKQRQKQWLLIKADDQYATSEMDLTRTAPESVITGRTNDELVGKRSKIKGPLDNNNNAANKSQFPLLVKPMLAQLADKPFDNEDWVFEVKWDGVRAIVLRNKAKGIRVIQSRNGKNITHRYPEILKGIDSAITKSHESVVLDGEIVVLNNERIPDFQLHQRRMNVESQRDVEFLSNHTPATYFVFDIIYIDDKNIEELDFVDRRKILDAVIAKNSKRVCISQYFEENGKALFKSVVDRRLEGIIAKYKYGKYRQGVRSSGWLKIKGLLTQDCVVIGYTKGEGNRHDYFGSLILASYEKDKLRFIGHAGSGFGFDSLEQTLRLMQRFRTDRCPVDLVPYTNGQPIWLRPELVVEVKFSGWTQDMIMRAPIFLRFRYDKMPNECIIENAQRQEQKVTNHILRVGMDKNKHEEKYNLASDQNFSNLDKIFWNANGRQEGLTKGDLIEYYDKVGKYILPHLRDRPLSLKRYPDGIRGKSFFHKNWIQEKPDYAKTIQVFSDSKNDITNYLICNNKETLLWLANLGCIEMHPWYSRVHNFKACTNAATHSDKVPSDEEDNCGLDTPDYIVFDLDPYLYSGKEKEGEEPEYNTKGFKAAVDVAVDLKDLLDGLHIDSYVKTSGKTGLHVFVPVAPIYTYDQTRTFAEIIGKMLRRRNPDKITMEWTSSNRKGKVFFDYNQNARGKTLASIFSVRPTISATISMPVKWRQLSGIQPADFTLVNVPDILSTNGDAWSNIYQKKQDLLEIMQRTS